MIIVPVPSTGVSLHITSFLAICGHRRCKFANRLCIDLTHGRNLFLLILQVVLNNTQEVNPEMMYAHSTSDSYSVAECQR